MKRFILALAVALTALVLLVPTVSARLCGSYIYKSYLCADKVHHFYVNTGHIYWATCPPPPPPVSECYSG